MTVHFFETTMNLLVAIALFFAAILTTTFCQDDGIMVKLQNVISTGNCTTLFNIKQKLSAEIHPPIVTISSNQMKVLHEQIQNRIRELNCAERRRRQISGCIPGYPGDGWCDADCNNPQYNFDKGDCCPQTCIAATYPCGSAGYRCSTHVTDPNTTPNWFTNGVKLCYKWRPDADPSQCGTPGLSKHICANFNYMTQAFRDNTNDLGGGCLMQWGIQADQTVPDWFKRVSICFRAYADGNIEKQCGRGRPMETCASFGSFTEEYLDDTDVNAGGCQMSWKLSIPPDAEAWMRSIGICFSWEPEDLNGQCGGGADRLLCAVAGGWTSWYRDDTDQRRDGCKLQWGFQPM